MNKSAILSLVDVGKSFDAVAAVSNVCFDLFDGRIYALIGPNGAGKTTLLNIISGYVGSDSGSIRLRGETIGGWTASRRVRQGMARTFQITQLFGHMTALENVMCGFHTHIAQSLASVLLGLPSFWTEERALRVRAQHLLETVGISDYANEPAGLLPFGLQRRLEIAWACDTAFVAAARRTLRGLSRAEAADLGGLLQHLSGQGLCVLLVEHNMPFIWESPKKSWRWMQAKSLARADSEEVRTIRA